MFLDLITVVLLAVIITFFLHVGGWRTSKVLVAIFSVIPEGLRTTMGWADYVSTASELARHRTTPVRHTLKVVTLFAVVVLLIFAVSILWSVVTNL